MFLTKEGHISRERSDHTAKKHPPIDPGLSKKIHLHNLGNISQFEIWLVDGPTIRDEIDIDYVEGGNPARYGYIPENEIWLEKEFNTKDLACTLIHEVVECWLMQNKHMTYDHAHDKASNVEEKAREKLGNVPIEQIITAAKEYYYSFLMREDGTKNAKALAFAGYFLDSI